jgi:hypothetical protein
VGRFLIWLSGAQPDILDRCRSDRAKYIGVGSAVLVTSSMAVVSMTFALHIALAASLPVAIPFALAWGLAILSLDRWLVVSMVRQRGTRYLMLAAPRLLLGLLFGIIISTPLTLQIFHVEIANQIDIDHTNAISAFNSSPSLTKLTAKVTAEQKAVYADQAVINSGGGPGTSPSQDATLTSLQQQLKSDQGKAQSYYNAWHCEIYGCPGHFVQGNGPAAKTDYKNYQHYTQLVQSDQQQITAEEQSLNARNKTDAAQAVLSARANLQADQARLDQDQATLTAQKQNFNKSIAKDRGILASLQALDELRSSSATLFMAEFLLFLFFTSIECLPIGVKVLLNLGPENTYERALAQADRVSLRRAENETMRQYLAAIREQDELNEESERLHAQWREAVLPTLLEEELYARERVFRARLSSWEARAMDERDRKDYFDDDAYMPGGFSRPGGRPVTDWTKARRRPRRRASVRPRVAAAWQAFRSAGTPPLTPHPAADPYWPNA